MGLFLLLAVTGRLTQQAPGRVEVRLAGASFQQDVQRTRTVFKAQRGAFCNTSSHRKSTKVPVSRELYGVNNFVMGGEAAARRS